jgi:hypothetical protein
MHYFFHLRDGTDTLIDAEGAEIESVEAARESALIQARDIIAHEARRGRINLAQRIDVIDEAGGLICSQDFRDAVEIVPPLPAS